MSAKPTPKRFECDIKDAVTPSVIHVKPEDIKGAVCGDRQRCAIARAIKRSRKSAKWVDVGAKIVLIGTSRRNAIRYVMPEATCNQVRYFDTHKGAFAPCAVKLVAPKGCLATGSRTGDKARSGKDKSKKYKKRQTPSR